MTRLGLFGGTFDPPHLGHLILAEAAREQLALDCVLWVVAGRSPLKLDREPSPVDMRIEMVEAAIAANIPARNCFSSWAKTRSAIFRAGIGRRI
ncbi:MAG: adenylyltransferase/cytidyltransferase family protein [Chloroflexi bacterium]|nr:adenylyltransferase/cytidyltransferase family protein [Chloroflexota bacterium]